MQPFSLHVAFVVFARAVSPILILSSWILMRGPTLAADGAAAVPITSVVELYTSQGCSSCPPADALFTSYMNKTGVLALSFNVDIWDNLGWKDTLASPQFTKRQRSYALILIYKNNAKSRMLHSSLNNGVHGVLMGEKGVRK